MLSNGGAIRLGGTCFPCPGRKYLFLLEMIISSHGYRCSAGGGEQPSLEDALLAAAEAGKANRNSSVGKRSYAYIMSFLFLSNLRIYLKYLGYLMLVNSCQNKKQH